jgi:hypothetical protein
MTDDEVLLPRSDFRGPTCRPLLGTAEVGRFGAEVILGDPMIYKE